jgi:hypothetical protein
LAFFRFVSTYFSEPSQLRLIESAKRQIIILDSRAWNTDYSFIHYNRNYQ